MNTLTLKTSPSTRRRNASIRPRRLPVALLPALAQVLRVSVDELVGYRPVETPAGRANPRLWHRLRQVEALPPQDRKQVLHLIDTLVERETLKKRSTRGG